jgi:uncharacterized Tic20 family protein
LADQPILHSLPEPTADERSMGLLAHILQVFTGFIGPLIILVLKPNSAFIKFHALQSLIWQLCYTALFIGGIIFFFFSIFAAALLSGTRHSEPPAALILVIPVFWLGIFACWITNVIFGVVYGLRANRGEWAGYPIIGKWCLPKLAPSPLAPSQPWAR